MGNEKDNNKGHPTKPAHNNESTDFSEHVRQIERKHVYDHEPEKGTDNSGPELRQRTEQTRGK